MKNIFKFLMLAALFALLVTGCDNFLNSSKLEPKSGVMISILSDNESERTLYPNANFVKYRLKFVNTDPGDKTHDDEVLENGSNVYLAELEDGTWEITAFGIVRINGTEYEAAEGTETITVTSGVFTSLDITISADQGGDSGFFSFNYTFSGSKVLDTAVLNLYNFNDLNTSIYGINLLNESSDLHELPAAYYLMTIQLDTDDNQTAGRTEIVHIYSNMETKAEFVFTDADFMDTSNLLPEQRPYADRWRTEDYSATATINYSINGEVVTAVFGGQPEANEDWRTKLCYDYSAEAGKKYFIKLEAWNSGDFDGIWFEYYWSDTVAGQEKGKWMGGMSTSPNIYQFITDEIPITGIYALRFCCGNKTGEFYVRVIDITEVIPVTDVPASWQTMDGDDWYQWGQSLDYPNASNQVLENIFNFIIANYDDLSVEGKDFWWFLGNGGYQDGVDITLWPWGDDNNGFNSGMHYRKSGDGNYMAINPMWRGNGVFPVPDVYELLGSTGTFPLGTWGCGDETLVFTDTTVTFSTPWNGGLETADYIMEGGRFVLSNIREGDRPPAEDFVRNMGTISFSLVDNFLYGIGYQATYHPNNLFTGSKVLDGDIYTLEYEFTASRDLEGLLFVGLVDQNPKDPNPYWKVLTYPQLSEYPNGEINTSIITLEDQKIA